MSNITENIEVISENEDHLHIANVLTPSESILSHCSSNFKHQVYHVDYISWLNTLVSLAEQLVPPYEHQVSFIDDCPIFSFLIIFRKIKKIYHSTNIYVHVTDLLLIQD